MIVGTRSTNAAPTERGGAGGGRRGGGGWGGWKGRGGGGGGRNKTSGVATKTDEGQKEDLPRPRDRRMAAGPVPQERQGGRKEDRGGCQKGKGQKEGGQPRGLPRGSEKRRWG